MKKFISLLLVAVMCFGFVACDKKDDAKKDVEKKVEDVKEEVKDAAEKVEEKVKDIEKTLLPAAEFKEKMDDYYIIDLRKAEDFEKGRIPGSVNFDLTDVLEDPAKAADVLKEAVKDNDKPIALICYTGNKYAQAATNALAAIEQDMAKVFTLEGGYKGFEKDFADVIEK